MYQVPYYTRHQYLAAQAEARAAEAAAKAAEAEFLAAEAIRQEEEALKARLYDIEQRKRYSRPSSVYSLQPPSTFQIQNPSPLAYGYHSDPAPPFAPSTYAALDHEHAYRRLPAAALPRIRRLPQPPSQEEILKARLEEERLARLAAEEELKRKEKELEAKRAREARQTAACCPNSTFEATSCRVKACRRAAPVSPQLKDYPQPGPEPAPAAIEGENVNDLLLSLFGIQPQLVSKPTQEPAAPSPPRIRKAPPTQVASKPTPAPQQIPKPAPATPARVVFLEDDIRRAILEVIDSLSTPEPFTKATKSQSKDSGKSLIEQLHARYQTEGDKELRDTIQATINSLTPQRTPSTLSSSTSKGKEKATTTHPSSSVRSSLEKVTKIKATFQDLEAEFTFPSQLDFVSDHPPSDLTPSTAFSHLAYTARNHPLRFYEQSLLSLLADLDLIESHGDPVLRSKRKEAVNQIERTLEALEREIVGRWKSKVAKEKVQGSSEATSSQEVSPKSKAATKEEPSESPVTEDKATTRAPVPSSTSESESPSQTPFTVPVSENDTSAGAPSATLSHVSSTSAAVVGVEESEETPANTTGAEDNVEAVEVKVEESEPTPTAPNSVDEEPATTGQDAENSESLPVDSQSTAKALTEIESPLEPHRTQNADEHVPSSDAPGNNDHESGQSDVAAESAEAPSSPVSTVPDSISSVSTRDEDSETDSFLLSHAAQEATSKRKTFPKPHVEDLGSDWSDLDA
ncbi:hypothetical protein CC1G_01666 [Coprinopsis cinerea okayama7|uniref:BAG domain-containing protein n=1 Tax=Coprinopsis cinerea (strain Okayama-7 / 130 / ATCC MYA-4618 / FGSC 9003) TaxID=240176 RepID=A8N2G6_COPC7|nr:hypothetical protein CC1G_01666 [Coprinopsis cinerea okayama7\|eukprot:XP_001828986.1 hypothetical protein CC1G_01666 [Coprinopsis cinerea okayama7\